MRFSLPWLELARLTRERLPRLAIVTILLIPTLYVGMYLGANWDPTGHLGRVDAAVVDLDTPATATRPDGTTSTVDAGSTIADTLTSGAHAGFTWHSTDAASAADGLADGRYAAVLTVPAGFSADLTSTAGSDPRQAALQVQTDDAWNYIVGNVTSTLTTTLRQSLSASTTQQYLDQVYVAFGTVHDKVSQAADGASRLADATATADQGAQQLSTGLTTLRTGVTSLATGTVALRSGAAQVSAGASAAATGATQTSTGASSLASGLSRLQTSSAALPAQTAALASGASTVSAGAAHAATGSQQLAAALDAVAASSGDPQLLAIAGKADALASATAQVSAGSATVAAGTTALAASAPDLTTGITQAAQGAADVASATAAVSDGNARLAAAAAKVASGATTASTGAADLASGVGTAVDGAASLADGAAQLRSASTTLAESLASGASGIPTYTAELRSSLSTVAATPVTSTVTRENAVANYGEGMAPYFIALGLWIGGMVSYMILRAVSTRALASTAPSWRAALSSWTPGAALGILQAIVLWGVLHLLLGLRAEHTLAAVGFAALVAVVFASIHQAFVAWFGGVGRFFGLVVLMLQLASAGGTYPVAASGSFYVALNHVLPMGYAVAGLRRLIAGGPTGDVWIDVVALVLIGAVALGATLLACHRRRTWSVTRLHPALQL